MAKDLNRCEFIGRLGQDVTMRYAQSGSAVANFSIAVSDKWKDKNTGQTQERTEWVRIVAFGKLAEVCGEYLSKGSRIYASGQYRTRKWNKDGVDMYTTEVNLQEMLMLDTRPQQGQQFEQGYGPQQQQPRPQQQQPRPQQQQPQQPQPQQPQQQPQPHQEYDQGQPDWDWDEDIPF